MNEYKKPKSVTKGFISSKFPSEFFQTVKKQTPENSPRSSSNHNTRKLTKVLKHLDKMPAQSTEKLFQPYLELSSTVSNIVHKNISLEDLITLSSSHISTTQIHKKVVHSQTLNLHIVQHYQINSKETVRFIRQSIDTWSSLTHPSFMQILEFYSNSPENYFTLVLESTSGTSLHSISSVLTSIPETILNSVSIKLLKVVKWLLENGKNLNVFEISSIICTKEGEIKILPRFENNWKENDESLFMSLGKILIKCISLDVVQGVDRRCCFFHSLNEDIMIRRVSKDFKDFLCKLTRYRKTDLNDLMNHEWIVNRASQVKMTGALVSLKEVLNIAPMKERGIPVDKIFENLRILNDGKKFSRPNTAAVYFLADDLGVPRGKFEDRINQVFNEIYS